MISSGSYCVGSTLSQLRSRNCARKFSGTIGPSAAGLIGIAWQRRPPGPGSSVIAGIAVLPVMVAWIGAEIGWSMSAMVWP
jgi:hypothetical protein